MILMKTNDQGNPVVEICGETIVCTKLSSVAGTPEERPHAARCSVATGSLPGSHNFRLFLAVIMLFGALLGLASSFLAWLNIYPLESAFWWHCSSFGWNVAFLVLWVVYRPLWVVNWRKK